MTTGKTIALTFVGIAMSLLFNMLYRSVIAFLPRSKHLLISWLQSLSTESEKAGLKLNIKKKQTKIMVFSSITSWQIEGQKVEAMTDFLFLGSKITAIW